MRIYFSATARNIEDDIDLYRSIQQAIQKLGHVITYNWVETVWHRQHNSDADVLDVQLVDEAAKAIEGAELLIVEASNGSAFGVGYEVAQALQHKKPVLVLIKKEAYSNSYAAGIKNELLTIKTYDESNYKKHIEVFIKENTANMKDLRFNFVIDRQIHNHLRRKSYETGMTKAEVVRDLLQRDMSDSG